MGVRARKFGQEMDKTGTSGIQGDMKRASKMADVNLKPDNYQKPSVTDSIILSLLRFKKRNLTEKKTGTK